jgi:hypothetical protein
MTGTRIFSLFWRKEDSLVAEVPAPTVSSEREVSENETFEEEIGEALAGEMDETPSDKHFLTWLRRRLLERKQVISTVGAEAVREAGLASQAIERFEHLDVRSRETKEVAVRSWVFSGEPKALFTETPPNNPYLILLDEGGK